MRIKYFAATLAFIVSFSFQPLSVRAEDLNNELQQAINANNWKQANEIIDKMIKVYSGNPDYVRELKAYRAKLKTFQSSKSISNNSHSTTNAINNTDALTRECQQELDSTSSTPPRSALYYYNGRLNSGIVTDDLNTISDLINKAAAEFRLEKYREAFSLYKQIIQISPGDPSAWTGMGYIMIKAKDYQLAIESFDQAAKAGNEPIKYRGLAYCALGNYQQAHRDLETYFQHDGGYDLTAEKFIKKLRSRT